MDYAKIKRIAIGILVADAIAVNAAVGYVVYRQLTAPAVRQPAETAETQPQVEYVDRCGTECQGAIDEAVGELRAELTGGPTPTPAVVYRETPKSKARTVTYVPISVSGSTTASDWVSLNGVAFYLDTADYPGLTEVYFEANIKLINGNGKAYARLYDATHGVGVQGSEVNTASQTTQVVESGRVSFWAGKNLIRVQAKSLTADTAVFEGGKLRVVTEN